MIYRRFTLGGALAADLTPGIQLKRAMQVDRREFLPSIQLFQLDRRQFFPSIQHLHCRVGQQAWFGKFLMQQVIQRWGLKVKHL